MVVKLRKNHNKIVKACHVMEKIVNDCVKIIFPSAKTTYDCTKKLTHDIYAKCLQT